MGDWLTRQFTLGGITFQNWTVVVLVIVLTWFLIHLADETMMRDRWYFIFSLFGLAIVLGWLLFVTFAE